MVRQGIEIFSCMFGTLVIIECILVINMHHLFWYFLRLCLLPWLILIVWILHHMQNTEPLCFLDERLLLLLWQSSPSLTKMLGYSCMMKVWCCLYQLLSLYLAPHHEGIQRALDVSSNRFPLLKIKLIIKYVVWLRKIKNNQIILFAIYCFLTLIASV